MRLGILLWIVTLILIAAGLYFVYIGTTLPEKTTIEIFNISLEANAAGLFVLFISIIPLLFALKEQYGSSSPTNSFQVFVYENGTRNGVGDVTLKLTGRIIDTVKTSQEGNVAIKYDKKDKNKTIHFYAKRELYHSQDGSFKLDGKPKEVFLTKRNQIIPDSHEYFKFYINVHEDGDLTKKIPNAEVRVAGIVGNLIQNLNYTDRDGIVTFSLPRNFEGNKLFINAEKGGYEQRLQMEINLIKDNLYRIPLKKKQGKHLVVSQPALNQKFPKSKIQAFISYNIEVEDEEVKNLANYLASALKSKGYSSIQRVDIRKPGVREVDQLMKSLEVSRNYIPILSRKSLDSHEVDYFSYEIRQAKKLYKQQKTKGIIPIWYDNDLEGLNLEVDRLLYNFLPIHFESTEEDVLEKVVQSIEFNASVIKVIEVPENRPKSIEPKNLNDPKPSPAAQLRFPGGKIGLFESKYYVERAYINRRTVEDECKEYLHLPHPLIHIKAQRQFGKTSLLSYLGGYCEKQNWKIVPINFQDYSSEDLEDLDRLLKELCLDASEKLEVPQKVDIYWRDNILRSKKKCFNYFNKYLLATVKQPMVLIIDEADRLASFSGILTEFFGMLRNWHEESKSPAFIDRWKNFKIVISYSREIQLLLRSDQSPLNVGKGILLEEFDNSNILEIANNYGLVGWTSVQVENIKKLVGGHPYLVSLICYLIAKKNYSYQEIINSKSIQLKIFKDHLNRLAFKVEKDEELLETFWSILRNKGTSDKSHISILKSIGLIHEKEGSLELKYQIYNHFFRNRYENELASQNSLKEVIGEDRMNRIRRNVEKNQFSEALSELRLIALEQHSFELQNEVSQVTRKLDQYQSDLASGILSFEQKQLMINRITKELLDLLDDFSL